ncbi:hypothetical protein [Tomitella biformata]|uniref:hypothetical protein n=1 Tax=Tomitella biformata TaxID=630403 RepID=UPI000465E85C|nr:hypothetical protein [Tomitella biformata]
MTRRPVDRGFVGYFVRLALSAAAAFASMLALAALVIVLVKPDGWVALGIVLVGVALAIGAMAFVSKWLTKRYLSDPQSERE